MSLLPLFLSALLYLSAAADSKTVVLEEGVFNYPFVFDDDIRHTDEDSTLFVTTAHRCVTSFTVLADVKEDSTLLVEYINGVDDKEEYTWKMIGEATLLKKGGPRPVYLFPAPICSSYWKFVTYSSSVSWNAISMETTEVPVVSKKRQDTGTTCFFSATSLYPPDCSSASDGPKCMSDGNCGCNKDNDCFTNAEFPYCRIDAGKPYGACDRCTAVEANPTTGNKDHYFCFSRYPGLKTHPTRGTALTGEEVAPDNFYREVCVRTPPESSGSCQRCNQAPFIDLGLGNRASNQGASGTVHCNKIKPDKPICMDATYMRDTNGTFNINLNGACGPCTTTPQCGRALPLTPICTIATGKCGPCTANDQCAPLSGKNCQRDGSCFSCKTSADCGAKDGGEKGNQVTCNTATGICEDAFQCTTNPSCAGKGGNNCQASGSCLTCTSNANCGSLDGGETPGQQVCNTATGICEACSSNAACVGTSGKNCQANGQCFTCTKNSDCGTLDGGETKGQPICNTATGICENACKTNVECTSKPGKNCQKDGTCVSCTNTSNSCGGLDGGETPDQPLCNAALGICTTPFTCTDNANCAGNGGANCQKDGTCISCTNATCGALDGGNVKDQPNCNTKTRICISACTKNADCVDTQGANCQKSGICRTCRSNADCLGLDGGEIGDQPICNVGTGICESPCKSNSDCSSKPGKNCQKDGSCVTCTSVDTCGAKDGGEITDQPVCRQDGICDYCSSNADCPKGAANCGADGICYACTETTCGELDGPPKGPHKGQPHCDAETGQCVDTCTRDEHCPDSCLPYCNVDKGCCVECVSSDHCPHSNWRDEEAALDTCSNGHCVAGCAVDADCAGAKDDDGTDLPACSVSEGKCVQCTFDSHCSEEAPACSVGEQKCVECISHDHCGDGYCNDGECSDEEEEGGSGSSGVSIAALVLAIIALILAIIAVVLLVTGKGGAEHV